jgi:hypothetical protein
MKPALLLVLVAPFAAADSLTVLDISQASASDVEQLKRVDDDAWWLEMGDQLVIAGPASAALRADSSASILARHDAIDRGQLLLRARGCSEHSTEAGTLLASGGRWELRQVAADEVSALRGADGGAWRALTPNTSLARQFRLDPRGLPMAPDPQVQQVVDRVDAARWFGDVQALAMHDRSSYATTSLEAARDWIGTQFDALQLATSLQGFPMSAPGGSITRHNALGAWIGSSQPERWIIVGAHYDSRNANQTATAGTPGAEDNASGCAGVIELARALLPSQPSRSILFICYAGEEQGLLGSLAHVQSLTQAAALASIDAVVIMDMIGYSADAGLEALYESSSTWSDYLLRFGAAAATYVPELDVFTSTSPFGSDHMPYLDAGVQTVLAIENDWAVYPHYHRSTDTPANMGPNAQAMGDAILRTNAAVIADLAGLPWVPFADGFEQAP